MKLIAGLGNPGPRYQDTYHNVGFAVVDELARRHGVRFEGAPADALMARVRQLGDGLLLVKPLTYMNLSGVAVGELQRYYKVAPQDVLIVLDEVALPLGRLRVRAAGSAGGHNGLESVVNALGTTAVPRLRIGIGRGDPRRDLVDRVLSRVATEERVLLTDAIGRAADAAEVFVLDGVEHAMNRYNSGIGIQDSGIEDSGNREQETGNESRQSETKS
ncbi:MAG: aminoacyl-tRNA hydrolase [Luteitalea sp.]|nr:aminoacyl-tRNA hydrolase [Luteitalea sp.]